MTGGAIVLGDVADRTDVLNVGCRRCGRAGKYKLTRLIEQHGRSFPIPVLLDELSADCPKGESVTAYDLLWDFCPGLAEVFGISPGSICK
jgi:hypothetical protein